MIPRHCEHGLSCGWPWYILQARLPLCLYHPNPLILDLPPHVPRNSKRSLHGAEGEGCGGSGEECVFSADRRPVYGADRALCSQGLSLDYTSPTHGLGLKPGPDNWAWMSHTIYQH